MSDTSSGTESWIDRIATEFDRAWHEGRRPRIEDYLGEAEDAGRALFMELLRIELKRRRRLGESPSAAEYEHRFADQAEAVHAAFQAEGLPIGSADGPPATESHRPGGRAEADHDRPPREDFMSDTSSGTETWIDRIATEFDRAWHEGRRPRIEDCLGAAPDVGRPLLTELLQIELQHRKRLGESPTAAEYERRFADHAEVVRAAFQAEGLPTRPEEGSDATVTHQPGGQAEVDPDATQTYSCRKPDGRIEPLVGPDGHAALRTTFPPGTVLHSRYIIGHELGHGGMGLVYRGRDQRLGDRPVAVKIILPDPKRGIIGEANVRAAFEEEARLGANLVHPAIATVYDFGLHDDVPFTVFEFIPGETLGSLLRRRQRLPPDEVRLIIGPLAQALDFAHSRHIVHRDLKPENIRATAQGQFKILDLGLARRFLQVEDWSGFSGTPAYAAPEQAAGLPCDGRADQYALALIAYELLTGRRLFEGRDSRELLEMHRSRDPGPTLRTLTAVPDTIRSALKRAMEKVPDKRYTSCEDFVLAMGCRLLLREPNPPPQVLLETDVKKMAGLWGMGRFAIYLSSKPIRLLLSQDSILASYRGSIMRWPLHTIESIRTQGDEALTLEVRTPQGLMTQSFWFSSREEQQRWHDCIHEAGKTVAGVPHELENPKLDPVVLFWKRPPNARYLILGPVESRSESRRKAEDNLKIRGAMLARDAVMEMQEEWLPEFNGTICRLTGIVLRAADQSGQRELKSRWLMSQMDSVFKPLILGEAIIIILMFTVPWIFVSIKEGIEWLILLHSFYFAMMLGALWLKWPQLMRTTTIIGYFLLFHPMVVLSYLRIKQAAFAVLLTQLFLLNRSRRCYREFVKMYAEAEFRTPTLRTAVSILMVAVSATVFTCPFFGTRVGISNAPSTPSGATKSYRLVEKLFNDNFTFEALPEPTRDEYSEFKALPEPTRRREGRWLLRTLIERERGALFEDEDSRQEAIEALAKAERRLTKLESSTTLNSTHAQEQCQLAEARKDLAWLIATRAISDHHFWWRHPREHSVAIGLAEETVRYDPLNANYWSTLGLAQYTVQDYRRAAESLEKATSLRPEGDLSDGFVQAAVRWHLGDREQAKDQYRKAVEWMDDRQPHDPDLTRLRSHVEPLMDEDRKDSRALDRPDGLPGTDDQKR